MQDIINVKSARATKPFFNTLFNTKNMANLYTISSSFFMTCHYSEKDKDLDNISQP